MLIKNLLFILQSEHYDINRFLNYAYSHWKWWGLEQRQKIKWTQKILAVYFITWLFLILFPLISFFAFNFKGLIPAIFLELLCLPVIISLALLIIRPMDACLKLQLINKAKKLLAGKNIIIVGITGSYGKTSAKEILYSILTEKFKVLKTPENINTDIGIARFVTNNLKDEEIFIVEMAAFYQGDIARICKFAKPDYSLLTGINEAHLERFGSLENTIGEKFTLAANTKKLSILNFDNLNIKENCGKFNLSNFLGVSKESAKDINFLDDFRGIEFNYLGEKFSCGLLAEHNIALILLCIEIAKRLGMNAEEMKAGVKKIKPINHRLSPIYNASSNIWVIDDSYNGNKDGFISGIGVLGRTSGRKVVLTPGIAELGERAKMIHNEIGKIYSKNADLVLLIKNKVSNFIISGMEKNGFKNYIVYNTTQEAHNDLKNVLKSGDTILFQNDWADNYF